MTKIEVLNFIQKNYHQCPDFNAANLLARVSNPVNFKKNVKALIRSDSLFFVDLLKLFLEIKKNTQINFSDKSISSTVDNLNKDGLAVIKGHFSDLQLEKVNNFQNQYLEALGPEARYGGKVEFYRDTNHNTCVRNKRFTVPHGELRCQSKSLGFHPPGVDEIISDPTLSLVGKSWFKDSKASVWRSTISYLSPSSTVHIPWHFDDFHDTIKIFVLLDDISLENGPMTYAKESNQLSGDYIKNLKHKFFVHGKTDLENKRPCNGWAKNVDDDCLSKSYVAIGDKNYENVVLTGKKGDAIIFDVSGFHSGNVAISGDRKVLVLSFPTSYSPLSKFFNCLAE